MAFQPLIKKKKQKNKKKTKLTKTMKNKDLFIMLINLCFNNIIVVPIKSDSDVILCLQLLSKTLTCAPYLI